MATPSAGFQGYNFGEVFVNALIAARERKMQKDEAARQRGFLRTQADADRRARRAAQFRDIEARATLSAAERAQAMKIHEDNLGINLEELKLRGTLTEAQVDQIKANIRQGDRELDIRGRTVDIQEDALDETIRSNKARERTDQQRADTQQGLAEFTVYRGTEQEDREQVLFDQAQEDRAEFQLPQARMLKADMSAQADFADTVGATLRGSAEEARMPFSQFVRHEEFWTEPGYFDPKGNIEGRFKRSDLPSEGERRAIGDALENAESAVIAASRIRNVDARKAALKTALSSAGVAYGKAKRHYEEMSPRLKQAFDANFAKMTDIATMTDPENLILFEQLVSAYAGEVAEEE